jgi:hypothetical protein
MAEGKERSIRPAVEGKKDQWLGEKVGKKGKAGKSAVELSLLSCSCEWTTEDQPAVLITQE